MLLFSVIACMDEPSKVPSGTPGPEPEAPFETTDETTEAPPELPPEETPPAELPALPPLAACLAPAGGFDPDELYALEGDTLSSERGISGTVLALGEGQPPDLCFSRAVVGAPGFRDTQDRLGAWFQLETEDGIWTVGTLSEDYQPALLPGDSVTVDLFDGLYGFEGADFGWFRLQRGEEVLFELVEDTLPGGLAAMHPDWDWRYGWGELLQLEENACGAVEHRALYAQHGDDEGEIPYGGSGTIGDRTVTNGGVIAPTSLTSPCPHANQGLLRSAAWPAR